MKKYYSLREISTELDIPKSTVVKYKDYFGDFLLMVGEGKRKKFDESAVEVLSAIRKLREEDKRDWLEIKDELEKRYGKEERKEEKGLARVEAAALAAPHLEHLKHMMNALAGELINVSDYVRKLDERSRRHSEALKVIARHAEFTKRNIELVIADLMERENVGRKQVREIAGRIDSEFRTLNEKLKKITEDVSGGDGGELKGNENLNKLAERLEGLIDKKSADGEKALLLKRENEMLKKKLLEARRAMEQPRAPSPPVEHDEHEREYSHGGERRRSRPAEKKKQKGWLATMFGK